MDLENIPTARDIKHYIEGCLNDFEGGEFDKEETAQLLYDMFINLFCILGRELK